MNPMLAVKSGAIVPVALPVFYPLNLKRAWSPAVLIGMAGAVAVYYMAWGRFFMGSAAVALLSAPLLSIPLPLALAAAAGTGLWRRQPFALALPATWGRGAR